MKRLMMLSLCALAAGCTSVRSTVVNRSETDNYGRNFAIPVKGIPITLKVPTHVDIKIVETVYLTNKGTTDYVDLATVETDRNLSVKVEPVVTQKLFTVDFKRPAAGELEYGAELSDEQYFTKVTGKIVDKTINEITNTIQAIGNLSGTPTSVQDSFGNIITVERIVAYKRFDIDACDVEDDILLFVGKHLNRCTDKCDIAQAGN